MQSSVERRHNLGIGPKYLVSLLGVLGLLAAAPALADTLLSTATYGYTGGTQTYTAPTNTQYVVIKAWGAGGGGGRGSTPGGGGAFVTANYYVAAGNQIQIMVGQGGGAAYAFGNNRSGGWPNGGPCLTNMGGGGGRTEVTTPNGAVIAGAGGGGGDFSGVGIGGGGGGGPDAQPGYDWPACGYAGTWSGPGQGGSGDQGNGSAGGFKKGGASGPYAGWQGAGGGDGYYGGGGGGSNYNSGLLGGSGGGGSSMVTGSPISYSYSGATWYLAGGRSDPAYPGADPFHSSSELPQPINIAAGGNVSGNITVGGNGYVVIKAYRLSAPPTMANPLPTQSVRQRQPVSYTIPATGDPSPSSYGATNLPSGLTLNASTGAISGLIATAGSYSCTVSASNAYGTASSSLTWSVQAASISANGSVVPGAIQQGNSVTLYRDGTANFGVAWTENVIWPPSGPAVNLGNQYGGAAMGSMSYTPTAGPGTYYYQLRVADIYYNYVDQWIPFQVSPQTHALPYTTGFEASEGYTVNGNLYPQFGWLVQLGAASILSEQAQQGSYSVKLIAGSQRAQVQKFFSGSASNSFVDVYVRPVAAATVTDSSFIDNGASRIGFVVTGGQGAVYAYAGNGSGGGTWTDTGQRFALNGSNQAASWLRLTAHHDYTTHTWNLIVNGTRAASSYGMVSNSATSLTDITWWGSTSAAAYFDNFAATLTNPFPAPGAPSGLQSSAVTDHSFTLTWTAPSGAATYEVLRGATSLGSAGGASREIAGLYPSTAYAMTVRAQNAAGYWSEWSSPLTVTTLADQTPPSAPTGLNATDLTPTSFTLHWNVSTDNVGATGYEVLLNGASQGTSTAATMNLGGLNGSTTYSLTVRARDAAGNWSAPSSVLTVTTPSPDPNADSDGDGVINGLEFSLGLNPYDPTDVNVQRFEYDKINQLKKGPAAQEYIKDAEGNIKRIQN